MIETAVLTKTDICEMYLISPATLDRQRKRGFPTGKRIGKRCTWTRAEVAEWYASWRPQEATDG